MADGFSGLQIINISNSANPTLVGNYDTPGNTSGIFVVDGYACLSDGDQGLQIIDIYNPVNPALPANYITTDWALNVFIFGNYTYVVTQLSLMILRFNQVGIEEKEILLPQQFSLSQNFPNPFNPITSISFELPKTTYVELTIYNILGQRVITPVAQEIEAGTYTITWNGRDENSQPLASGVYFYMLKTEDFVQAKKMMLLK